MELTSFAEVEYTIDYPLFLKFFRLHNREHVPASFFGYIVPPLGLIFSLATGIAYGFDWLTLGLAVASCALLAAKLYSYFLTPKALYQKSREVYEASHTLTLYDANFLSSVGGNSHIVKYAELHKVYETPDMFCIYISATQVTLLPKDTISDQASLRLRSALQRQLAKKFILRTQ